MMLRIFILGFLTCFTLHAQGEMLRVLGVLDGKTIAVDRSGKAEPLPLAGIEVTDEVRARELLVWTIGSGSSWVLAERAGSEWKVWRSPDALFLNEELVNRGYARPTLPGIAPAPQALVTYLGQIDPPGTQKGAGRAAPAAPKTPKARAPAKAKPPRRVPARKPVAPRAGAPPVK